ncbi:SGNH/GDSL hydrolase family protein [Roseomonas sp. GCM10028921]
MRSFAHLAFALFLTGASMSTALAQSASQPKLRILALGDSITSGTRILESYRYPLWKKLITGGYAFDFIGSRNTNFDGTPSFLPHDGLDFDRDNEGHWGWRADQVLGQLPQWLRSYTPDVVLLNIGSNDLGAGDTVPKIATEIGQIIDRLRNANPSVIILISNLTPTTGSRRAGHVALGAEIPNIAQRKTTSQSPVQFVDIASGYDPAWLADSIHPNFIGEEFIATRFYDALSSLVRPNSVP